MMDTHSAKTQLAGAYAAICQRAYGFSNDTLTITAQSLAYKGAKVRLDDVICTAKS